MKNFSDFMGLVELFFATIYLLKTKDALFEHDRGKALGYFLYVILLGGMFYVYHT